MDANNQTKIIKLLKVFSDAQQLFEAYGTHFRSFQKQLDTSAGYFEDVAKGLKEFLNEHQTKYSNGLEELRSGNAEEKR